MSQSAKALKAAADAYAKEHANSKQHESIVSQLQRLVAEAHKGTAAPQDSPGRVEAVQAAERAKPDSGGNEQSNKPGDGFPFHKPSEHPNVAGGDGPLKGSDVVFSHGQRNTNDPAPAAHESTGKARNPGIPDRHNPDQKHDPRAREVPANVESNHPGPPAPNSTPTSAVGASHSSGGTPRAPSPDGAQPESRPPYAGEPVRKKAVAALKAAHRAS